MSLPQIEIPLGAMRFNSDSQKLEYWNGSAWFQIQTFSPNLNGGTRGVYAKGTQPGGDANTIQFITISTAGNAQDFGDAPTASTSEILGGVASNTRGVFAGGYSNPAHLNIIEFVTIAQQGNSQDFGDLAGGAGAHGGQGLSNQTRGIYAIGNNAPGFSSTNRMDFITIASTGNATDFGDTITTSSNGACGSPTRGVLFGGSEPSGLTNLIQFITIGTLGNAQEFGDLPTIHNAPQAAGNSIRGLNMGGSAPSPAGDVNTIEYITIATTGNGRDFGDLTQTVRSLNATSDPTRMVRLGGYSDTNVMDYVQIATTGDAIDFGDLINISRAGAAFSNGQGGLG